MPNLEQLRILYRGVQDWNEWRKENPEIKPDLREVQLIVTPFSGGANLSGVNLSDTDLSGAKLIAIQLINANLSRANLWGASLRDADLRQANLCGANLNRAILGGADLRNTNLKKADLCEANLSRAKLNDADLSDADLREAYLREADLIGANLRNADLCKADLFRAYLRDSNLSGAKLNDADLSETDLNWKDLSGVNLSGACLAKVQALGTNFEKAKLTGACLQDWNINSATKLDNVSCDYVYLQVDQQERRPHNKDKFTPGEFTKLFQKARETVDLIFRNGLDWQAFLVSFQQLQVEAGDKALFIQAIENKNDGAFIIRVSVPPELDKSQIELYFKRKYQIALKARDEQYRKYLRERLKDKDDVIANYREQISEMKSLRQDNTQLIGIIETMAEKEGSKYYFHQSQIGNVIDTAQSGSRQQSINHQHNYAPEQKQMLAEAAEIQQLLAQLETQGYSPKTAQQKVASDLVSKAQSDPTFKNQLVKWGQYLGDAAANGLIGEGAVTVLKGVCQMMGIPIP